MIDREVAATIVTSIASEMITAIHHRMTTTRVHVGTTGSMEKRLAIVRHHATTRPNVPLPQLRETSKPASSRDISRWQAHSKSPFFMWFDKIMGSKFLVDTGAEVSILPSPILSPLDRQHRKSDFVLEAVNKTHIPTYGERSLTIDLGLRCACRWIFTIADVPVAILGADFLQTFRFQRGH